MYGFNFMHENRNALEAIDHHYVNMIIEFKTYLVHRMNKAARLTVHPVTVVSRFNPRKIHDFF